MHDPAESVDIVGLGQNATDTIIRIPYFPAHDSKVEFKSAQLMPGGQVASAMVACQKWGLKCRYIGKVGDDSAAELQAQEMSKAGVEAHWIRVSDCVSQVAYILVDEATGERTIIWRRDARLEIHPDEIQESWITTGRILHVDGHNTAASERVAHWARAAEIPVVARRGQHLSGLGRPASLGGLSGDFEDLP